MGGMCVRTARISINRILYGCTLPKQEFEVIADV